MKSKLPSVYRIADERGVYTAAWIGKRNYDRPPQSPPEGPRAFNGAVRQDPWTLIAGDVPRMAIGTKPRSRELNPPWFKLGDLRIGVTVAGDFRWLDETGSVETRYCPWGWHWSVDLQEWAPLRVDVTAFLADGKALAVQVRAVADRHLADARLWLCYGGVCRLDCVHLPEYFLPDSRQEKDNCITLEGGRATLTDPSLPVAANVVCDAGAPALLESEDAKDVVRRVGYIKDLGLESAETRLLAWESGVTERPRLEDFDLYRSQSVQAAERLLEPYRIDTPDPHLDAAFDSAVINLDYSRQAGAYLEGVQVWSTHWANNYQISAAVALGRFDEARRALRFVAGRRPGEVLYADGSPVDDWYGWQHDALPYFVLQLHRYWRASGDHEILHDLWEPLRQAFEGMMRRKDPAGTGLLSWHWGCNSFLYQSDHLSLPGAGFSPSAMLVGTLRCMADMAAALAETSRKPAGVGTDGSDTESVVWTFDPSVDVFISVNDMRGPDGIVYLARKVHVAEAGDWILHVGHDGGARAFLDGEAIGGEAGAVNPAPPIRTSAPVTLAAGEHEIVVALDRAGGKGWGIFVSFEIPEKSIHMQNDVNDARSETKPCASPKARVARLTAPGWKVSRLMPPGNILAAAYLGLDQDGGWEDWYEPRLRAQAILWRRQADYTEHELVRRFWLPAEGRFAGCIDPQGLVHAAAYYTDFVFPQLYTQLPAEYTWLSLRALDRTLWNGEGLMRVGNFKPGGFGNDAVQPVQLCEAAEAYFRAGRSGPGLTLLHGAARTHTVCTQSPGAFCEQYDERGWGNPAYIFGNPIGAYLQAVVGGLFGLTRAAAPRPVEWAPAIPEDWRHARLRLGDIDLSVDGQAEDRLYRMDLSAEQSALFRLPLYGKPEVSLLDEQLEPVTFERVGRPGGDLALIRLEPRRRHSLHVRLAGESVARRTLGAAAAGRVEWQLPGEGWSVRDVQGVFGDFRITGNALEGTLAHGQGPRAFFLLNGDATRACECEFALPETPERVAAPVTGPVRHLDLAPLHNSDHLWNEWGRTVSFTPEVSQRVEGGRRVVAGAMVFRVGGDDLRLAVVEAGHLGKIDGRLLASTFPDHLVVPVRARVMAIQLLCAATMKVRLTGMRLGQLRLRYADGFTIGEPLVYGRNLDNCGMGFNRYGPDLGPKSTETERVSVVGGGWLFAFTVRCDPERVLEAFIIEIVATDVQLGLVAVNAIESDGSGPIHDEG